MVNLITAKLETTREDAIEIIFTFGQYIVQSYLKHSSKLKIFFIERIMSTHILMSKTNMKKLYCLNPVHSSYFFVEKNNM